MENMYFIEYKPRWEGSWIKRALDRCFINIRAEKIDGNKSVIFINKKRINRLLFKRIDKIVFRNDSQHLKGNVLISKELVYKDCIIEQYIPKDKYVAKLILPELLQKVEEKVNAKFELEDLYISINSEKSADIIGYVAHLFRSVNIVTTKLKKIQSLEERFDTLNMNYVISNNRKKFLKKAKILVNIDFSSEVLSGFNINRNCILINLNHDMCKLKSSFHGTVINSIAISYDNKYKNYINLQNYDGLTLYESFVQNEKYSLARGQLIDDSCRITELIGDKYVISQKELLNNYSKNRIKLDKL